MNIEQPLQVVANGTGAVAESMSPGVGASGGDVAVVRVKANAAPATPQPAVQDAVKAAAQQIDSYLKSTNRNLDIHVDDATGQMVVTVRDATTGDVIRQIPNEEALRLARSLGEHASALLDLSA